MTKTVAEIAAHVAGKILGDPSKAIDGIASLDHAPLNSLIWVDSEKNLARALASAAAALIVGEELHSALASTHQIQKQAKTLILVQNPRLAFAKAVSLFHPVRSLATGIDAAAHISPKAILGAGVAVGPQVTIETGAVIGDNCEIAANCYVGSDVRMGDSCRIYPGVKLYPGVTLGNRCVVHAGAVIGSDGFGFVPHEGRYHKFPQVGTVIIGDDVEIGANTTIDRGTLDATRIGRGTKIDNLVQIAHNVEIGEDVVIAAQTGISGGTVIEDHCVIGGQVGMGDHARVKRGAVVGSKGGILPGKIIREGQVVWGIPAIPLDEYKAINALWRGLPKLKEDVEALKKSAQSKTSRPKKHRRVPSQSSSQRGKANKR